MPYSYDPIFAADPNNPSTVASNAAITLFNPADAGKAPITITDVTGSPLPNPITVNRNGFGPAFQHATLDRVGWMGGGFTGYFTSYEGMKAEAVSARTAAQEAATNAGSAATIRLDELIAAGNFKGPAGPVTNLTVGTIETTAGNPLSDAVVASEIQYGTATKAVLDATYAPGVSVLRYGAVGDGTTLDHAAINAAITANPGKTITLPTNAFGNRVYLVNATASIGASSQPVGIKLNTPGVRLLLEQGVTIKAKTNAAGNYAVVQVTAADCTVEGGTIEGDRPTHTGSTGEWGHCLDVNEGAHRFTAVDTVLREGWGDGCQVMGQPEDVSFVNVIADRNRRQGLSIIDAIRPRVIGGSYMNTTGSPGVVGLGCGILLEPDHGTDRLVTGAIVSGATVSGNRGPGLATSSNGRPLSATITGVRSENNGAPGDLNTPGVRVYGDTNKTVFVGIHSEGNSGDGFLTEEDCVGVVFNGCVATANGRNGFTDAATRTLFNGCTASDNNGAGFSIGATSDAATIAGGVATSNTAPGRDVQVDIHGTNAVLSSVVSSAGTRTPNYGFVVRGTATGAKLHNCTANGMFASGAYLNQADAIAIPTPGTVDLTIPGKVTGRVANSGAAVLAAGVAGQAQDRLMVLANGTVLFTNGTDSADVSISRHGLGVAGVGAGEAWRTGAAATGARPSASTVGAGSQFFDTTLGKPIWSNGTVWKDAAGATV